MERASMAHDQAPAPQPGPLAQPVTRLEFYVVIVVALGTKTLPLIAPGAATALAALAGVVTP